MSDDFYNNNPEFQSALIRAYDVAPNNGKYILRDVPNPNGGGLKLQQWIPASDINQEVIDTIGATTDYGAMINGTPDTDAYNRAIAAGLFSGDLTKKELEDFLGDKTYGEENQAWFNSLE